MDVPGEKRRLLGLVRDLRVRCGRGTIRILPHRALVSNIKLYVRRKAQ